MTRCGAESRRLLLCSMMPILTTVLLIGPASAHSGLLPGCMTMQLGMELVPNLTAL